MLKSHKKTIFEILGRSPIHPFPARMAPGIALEALGESDVPLRVLDPMAGSGTVLAVARSKGHRAIGVDVDPLAVLLARTWTRTVDAARVSDKAAEVLSRARGAFHQLAVGEAYPVGSDDETRAFVRYWFDDYARRQLTALSQAIRRVHDHATRDVLWCGFSRLIIAKSAGASLAMDLAHSRPHKRFEYAPVKPFNRFLAAVKAVASNCPQMGKEPIGPASTVKLGDARRLSIDSNSIDLVLTSPPYLNAIDYLRCSKFALVWMGHAIADLRRIRRDSVGTEASSQEAVDTEWIQALIKRLKLKPRLSDRHNALLSQYVWDISGSLEEVSRVLKVDARAVYVVGDSTVRGTFVRNSSIVAEVAQRHGLVLRSRHSRALPASRRYLPPPRGETVGASIESRMRREVVLEFTKPASAIPVRGT